MTVPVPSGQPGRRIDVTALSAAVDDAALKAFIAESKATGRPWSRMTTGVPRPTVGDLISRLMPVVIPLVGIAVLLVMGGPSLIEAVAEFTREAPFPLNLVIVGFFGLIVLGSLVGLIRVLLVLRTLFIPRWWWLAAYRLTRLASANGLRYGHDERPSYPGIIFGTGSDRTIERRLTTTAGRRVEIANYRYTITGEDRDNVKVYGWGYVAIALDRRLPHLLLDAKANDTSVFGLKTSNLPVDLARDQRLSLGGEFDQKFTLYAPSDYGRDAFYVFTPDLMALFIDRLGAFDVEIIDDTMFVYGSRFDLLDPNTYLWLQDLVETVAARTVRRTERYRDDFALLEDGGHSDASAAMAAMTPMTAAQPAFTLGGDGPPHVASNTIAAGGRRLRRRTWGLWSLVGVLLVIFWIYNEFLAPLFGWPRLED